MNGQAHFLATEVGLLPRDNITVRTIDTGGAGPISGLLEARRMIGLEGVREKGELLVGERERERERKRMWKSLDTIPIIESQDLFRERSGGCGGG
jgi:hypothetical protein